MRLRRNQSIHTDHQPGKRVAKKESAKSISTTKNLNSTYSFRNNSQAAVRGSHHHLVNTPDFIKEKKLLQSKRAKLKVSQANITNLLNRAKLDTLEKAIAENDCRPRTPFESRSAGSQKMQTDRFGSDAGLRRKESAVDHRIYNFTNNDRFGSLKSIWSKRNSASHAMNMTLQHVAFDQRNRNQSSHEIIASSHGSKGNRRQGDLTSNGSGWSVRRSNP